MQNDKSGLFEQSEGYFLTESQEGRRSDNSEFMEVTL